MRVGVCFSIFLLCAALAHAAPASKATEKKSLAEDTKFESKKEDLKIDETGEDKDRTKKSAATFCVEIQPGSSQPTQVSCKDNQVAAQNTPLTIQTDTISQPIQAVSVVQPFMQTIPQPNIVVPQYIPQPFQTVQIVQPPQPCVQSTPSINVVQSVPQSNVIHTSKPKPKPTPASTVEIETTPEPPKPACIEQLPQPLPEPQESFAVLPVAPAFHKNFITIPSSSMVMVPEVEQAQLATIVQVPSVSPCSNPLHGILSPCTCQKNVAVMSDSNVEPMTMKVLPLAPYSSSFASSPYPLVMPYDSKMLPQILTNGQVEKLGPQGRNRHHTTIHLPHFPHIHYPHHGVQNIYESTYIQGPDVSPNYSYPSKPPTPSTPSATGAALVNGAYGPNTVTVNAFPQLARAANLMMEPGSLRHHENASNSPIASGANDPAQSTKIPREAKSSRSSAKKTEEDKQQETQTVSKQK